MKTGLTLRVTEEEKKKLEALCALTGKRYMTEALLHCAEHYPQLHATNKGLAGQLKTARQQYDHLVKLLQKREDLLNEAATISELVAEHITDSEDDCLTSGIS